MISIHEQINEAFAYLHGLWRYRWSALLISWLVALAGWIGVYSLPNKYSAQAIVHIDAASMLQPLLRGLSVETNLAEELNMMNQVLLSRENLLSVLEETGQINELSSLEQREQAFWDMRQMITLNNVGGGRKSRARTYGIIHTSTSPELSYQVVSSLLNTLIEKTLEAGRTDTVMAEEFLDEQIRDHEARLAESEARLAEFKKEHVGLMPGEAGDYYNRLQRSKDDIERTRSELRQAKQRYAELRRQLTGESPMLGSSAYSRSTAAKLRSYREQRILDRDPFASLDVEGVGQLISLAVERGRRTRPGLKLGICGEHGGDPASIRFFVRAGLDYVSASPYRVPTARLAAAHATLHAETSD